MNRMVLGAMVIDHDDITGLPGTATGVAAIYEVTPAGISKLGCLGGSSSGPNLAPGPQG